MPAGVADIIQLYAARPQVAAIDYSCETIHIFTGDWTSPAKSIRIKPRLPVRCFWDVCEFQGAFVVVNMSEDTEWNTIVADNRSKPQENPISSHDSRTRVQFQSKLYIFGDSYFAVFDRHAKCFLPEIMLPPGCTGVMNACVFKGLLYLLMMTKRTKVTSELLRHRCFEMS